MTIQKLYLNIHKIEILSVLGLTSRSEKLQTSLEVTNALAHILFVNDNKKSKPLIKSLREKK